MIAVGLSQNAETRHGVREAVERASFKGRPAWMLAVAGRRHEAGHVIEALREIFPGIPVYGGSCVGAIGANRIGYSGSEIAIALFDETLGEPEAFVVEPLAGREYEAGLEIGEWMAQAAAPAILFYDVTNNGSGINLGSRLLDGVYGQLPEKHAPLLVGAGLIADFQVTRSHLFDGADVRTNAALVLRLPPGVETSTRVMHGCTPASAQMTVTRAEGARIFELDGRPAVDVLREFAGASAEDDLAIAFSVLLGRRVGDPHAPFAEADFMNRLIIDVDTDSGSVGLFEEDIRTGDRVQIMVRNNSLLMDSVEDGVRELLGATDAARRRFALYIDCAGRASVFTGSENEESELLLKELGGRVPVLGFYVGREIAPFAGRSRPLDWTGVLTIFSTRG